MAKDRIPGGLAKDKTLKDLAIKYSYDDSKDRLDKEKFNSMLKLLKQALQKGIKVEIEHTNNEKVAKEIAMDHLWEDPYYYEKLQKMEKSLNEIRSIIKEELQKSIMINKFKEFFENGKIDNAAEIYSGLSWFDKETVDKLLYKIIDSGINKDQMLNVLWMFMKATDKLKGK